MTEKEKKMHVFAREIFQNILDNEKNYSLDVGESWIKYRRSVVDWISEYGDDHKARLTTIHLCISMLDRMMVKVRVEKKNLQKIAVACMHIAMKVDGRMADVPTISTINNYFRQFEFTVEDMFRHEVAVLDALDMNILTYTSSYFIEYWLDQGAVFEDDKLDNGKLHKRTDHYVKRYSEFFSELSQQELSFRKYKESLMGAACLYCSRKALKLSPLWREELHVNTTYSEETIVVCARELWEYYVQNFPEKSHYHE